MSERLATLRELNDYYTLEEMYQMYEIIHVNKYNSLAHYRYVASKSEFKKGKNVMRFRT